MVLSDGSVKVFYVRHKLCLTSAALRDQFIREGIVAIHYADIKSWNLPEYGEFPRKSGLGKSLGRFKKMEKSGAWVVADYPPWPPSSQEDDMILIGRAEEHSLDYYPSPDLCHDYDTHEPRGIGLFKEHHIYKILRLKAARKFRKSEYDLFRLPLGRDSICESRRLDAKTVECIYERTSLPKNVRSLVPAQLELLCQEYLRKFHTDGIPKLEYLLSPVGEQIKGVDINGTDIDGTIILCQVTQASGDRQVEEKIAALRKEKGLGRALVYFGPKEPKEHKGISFLSIETVFRQMSEHPVYSNMVKAFLMHNAPSI